MPGKHILLPHQCKQFLNSWFQFAEFEGEWKRSYEFSPPLQQSATLSSAAMLDQTSVKPADTARPNWLHSDGRLVFIRFIFRLSGILMIYLFKILILYTDMCTIPDPSNGACREQKHRLKNASHRLDFSTLFILLQPQTWNMIADLFNKPTAE